MLRPLCLLLLALGFVRTADARELVRPGAAWKSGPNAPVARTVGSAVRFPCPFASEDRVYWDQSISLNLSGFSSVELDVDVPNPAAFRRLSVHFASGTGWYSALTPVLNPGRQRFVLPLGGFDREGKPAGWRTIQKVRVSGWRGTPGPAEFRLHGLRAKADAITLYQATSSERSSAERSVARRSTQRISTWLNEVGVGHGIVTDEDFRGDSLRNTQVLILPYNRTPGKTALSAITSFQRRGGKTIGFHDGPAAVVGHVGARILPMVSTKTAGTFNAMRLERSAPYPDRVFQHVWNVVPLGTAGGSVVGRWEDSRKRAGSTIAIVGSPRGFWFGQVFRDGDSAGKQQLLLAMIGELYPELWRAAAEGRLEACGRKLGAASFTQVVAKLQAAARGQPRLGQLVQFLPQQERAVRKQLAAGSAREAYEAANQLGKSIDLVWASSQTSRAGERRAVWEPNGTGLVLGDWDHTCRQLKQHGFNTLFPCMLWGGKSHVPNTGLPASGTLDQYGDQLRPCLAAAKRHGIEVHVWKICWSLENASSDFRFRMKKAGRLAEDRSGTTKPWLCPSHSENRKMELKAILEVARRYKVDGIHLDYMRYSDRSVCFSPTTRRAYERWRGSAVKSWPPSASDATFQRFRAEEVTRFMQEVRRELKKVRPSVKLSVAVWPAYPTTIESIGQDYGAWLRQDLVDFLTPMNYTRDVDEFRRWCRTQSGLAGGRGKIVPGLAAIANEAELDASEIIRQVRVGRELGLPGFALFKLDHVVVENVFPQLSAGLTRTP